jgi:MFS superfamily sulfate permease-like transporter
MTDRNSLANLPTKRQLENARTKGQLVGWIQGGLAVGAVWLLLGLVGWIPVIALAGVAGYIGYRLLFGRSKRD